jgi:hypothetical protein
MLLPLAVDMMIRAAIVAKLQGVNADGSARFTETVRPIASRVLGLSDAELIEDHPRCS